MFVQADLNSAPKVLRSVSVKNFKKNVVVLVDSGDVLKRPNIFPTVSLENKTFTLLSCY